MTKIKEWWIKAAPALLGGMWVAILFSVSLYLLLWSIVGIIRIVGAM